MKSNNSVRHPIIFSQQMVSLNEKIVMALQLFNYTMNCKQFWCKPDQYIDIDHFYYKW